MITFLITASPSQQLQGFEVRIGGYKFFAFSHYHANENGGTLNVNDCDRTFIGWYALLITKWTASV